MEENKTTSGGLEVKPPDKKEKECWVISGVDVCTNDFAIVETVAGELILGRFNGVDVKLGVIIVWDDEKKSNASINATDVRRMVVISGIIWK